jgi:hypothetical protein
MRAPAVLVCLLSLGAHAAAQDCKTIKDPAARLACFDKAQPAKGDAFAATKSAVAKNLKDPASAQFTNMARSMRPNAKGTPTDTVCGSVNAKNSFGGYTGARPFVHFVADNSVHIAGESDLDTTIVRNFCK